MGRSQSLKERLMDLGCPEEKFRLNRTGIPLDNFPFLERSFPENGAFHFVQACRLIEKKGLDVALRAFAQFKKDHPASKFTIAGEGPLKDKMALLASELGISESVHFAGFLSEKELCALYHSAHIFVHPSQLTAEQNQEGIPNSMLEAMSTGLPVIATLHGGIPEAVDNGITGLLSPERDLEALLANIRLLANNAERWSTMSAAASKAMRDNFEHGAQIARLESVYSELLEIGKQS